uniref:F-BAR domain only protein 1-like n=1 Tax=Scleropages formosus TaxID=113540 RepID=A0A8C9W5M1_SCLFO
MSSAVFQGEKNAGFDVLYHNMKHGQLATKELAEFVRERAAIEETYSKSMSKLAKMASNGSSLGTFAPMWDLFRVSADKLALCHLELMRKMNDLIRDINKYGDEQVKVHRKMKEGAVGTVEAIQALQVHNGQLQKSRENHLTKRAELERLRREGAPHKELEKAELKLKKAAASFSCCIEKYNRVAGDFELKMSDSAQRFQDIEETHLRQMKQLIKSYLHSIEDTHVQLGQVHEELKQNVENIGTENLIQKFAEQKGTGKDKPSMSPLIFSLVEVGKNGGLLTCILGIQLAVLPITASLLPLCSLTELVPFIRCPQEREENFYSSDSDFDDDEPKKFHILIRPVGSSTRSGVSRGPSPISQSSQESWPVAAAITEYINAYFPGGQHSRCLVKITGDFTMSFPAGITVIFAANPNIPVLSFRLVNLGHVENILPNKKLLCSGSSQSGVESREFWFNMQALSQHLQKEAELNPQASYYNVGLVKYQVSSQDPGHAPMLLCAECQRSGTVTRVSLDYRWCPAMAPDAQLTSTQVLLPLDHTASDVQCQPPGACHHPVCPAPPPGSSHTSGQLCASWQSSELSHGPNPSLAVQFVGTGASLSGLDVELVGSRYRMSLVKKRFATGTRHTQLC